MTSTNKCFSSINGRTVKMSLYFEKIIYLEDLREMNSDRLTFIYETEDYEPARTFRNGKVMLEKF